MVDLTPIPWPDEIQDYFSEHSAIAWVPRFMHEPIAAYTKFVAEIDPGFRYQDIAHHSDGFRIRFKDEPASGSSMETIIRTLEIDFNAVYFKFSQEYYEEMVKNHFA